MARKRYLGGRRKGRFGIHRGFTRVGGYYGRYSGAGAELKFHDLDTNDAAIAANGTIVIDSCNEVAQGVTESTRVGRKFVIRSINWRFSCTKSVTTSSVVNDTVRVILYLDKQCNGATAGITDILESDDFQSFNNLANKSRFRTLMDRTYSMNSYGLAGDGTTTDGASWTQHDSFFKNVTIPIEYDATAAAITGIRSNNIGLLLLSQNGTCSFSGKMRLRFSDG